MAEKVGISQPYLNEILNDAKPGSAELLEGIAEAIGISLRDLLSQDDSPKLVAETADEEKLLSYFRGLDTQKKFLLLHIAADYHQYCTLVKEGKIKP